MDRTGVVLAWLALIVVSLPPAFAEQQGEGTLWENPHYSYVKTYEGTKTCLACHDQQAKDVFASVHYQWKGDAPNLVGADGNKIGKINSTNDFCTNPSFQWIAILTNDQGKVIGNGCSKCHTGLGAKPSEQMSTAQLENIDCLVCHAANYRRTVAKQADGSLKWQPVQASNPEAMLNVAQTVGRPSNDICLRCHVGSGGGLNYKRGDLETAHSRPTRDFDVHMGSGMQCIQCHKFRNHRVMGGGTQMGGMDVANADRPQCETCHKGQVHRVAALNRHTSAVYCTTCHIARFAQRDQTDMHRDWSRSTPIEGEGRFEPEIRFASNVTPVYAWWNGTGRIALLDEPVRREANGKVAMYRPEGSINDPKARIYAFKYHTGRLPIDKATQQMIPVQVGAVFKTGNNMAAVKGGAKAYTGKDVTEVDWIDTERYLGLFHEVAPAKDAVQCAACHGGNRLDWKALGYRGDPMKIGGRKIKPQPRT